METKIITIRENHIDGSRLQEAGDIIRRGGLVAFPTETVYGLGADALNREAACKIYEAKGRPSDNPLIIHICRWEDIYSVVSQVPQEAEKIARAFWPGPLTMILPKSQQVPYETTGGLETVAIRMPSHQIAAKLIDLAGGYIAAPSANTSGKPSPTLAKHVITDMRGRIDMIIDGGDVGIGLESTIIDLTVTPPQILRPGYVTRDMLERVLGTMIMDGAVTADNMEETPKAPGMKYRHYAPRGEITIVRGKPEKVVAYINREAARESHKGEKVGIISTAEDLKLYRADSVKNIGSREAEADIARHLYRILREFDDEEVTKIYSEAFEDAGLGQAIMNRLLKAAGHRIVQL